MGLDGSQPKRVARSPRSWADSKHRWVAWRDCCAQITGQITVLNNRGDGGRRLYAEPVRCILPLGRKIKVEVPA